MNLSIRKSIPAYHEIPRWYGLAYREEARGNIIVYLIPLNWIVGLWRRFKICVMLGPTDWLDQAYEQGYRDGQHNLADTWHRKLRWHDAEISRLRGEIHTLEEKMAEAGRFQEKVVEVGRIITEIKNLNEEGRP